MDRVEACVQVTRDLARVADEHGRALVTYFEHISRGMRGPKGDRLQAQVQAMCGELRGAVERAHAIADDAIWREIQVGSAREPLSGPPAGEMLRGAPAPLSVIPSPPPLARTGSQGFAGVDPAILREGIRVARSHGGGLTDGGRRIVTGLGRAGLDPSPGHDIVRIGDWLLGQQYELRGTIERAEAADAAMPDVFGGLGAASGPVETRIDRLNSTELSCMSALGRIAALPVGKERAERTAAWWARLSPEMRMRLSHFFPRTIGSLDGIPAGARHWSNTTALRDEIARLNNRLSGMSKDDPDYEKTRADLDAAQKLQQRLNVDAAAGEPRPYLLGFGTEGVGKAIVSYGNPDTAKNVITTVPGLYSKLGNASDYMDRALDIWDSTEEASGYQNTTASIFWLDYDAPQSIPRAGWPSFAETGIKPLGGFLRGLEAGREGGEDAHTTVLAHSYGSTTTGMTAVEYPQLADDLILVGSPGVGVDHARDLKVDPDHVWAGASPWDPVADLGRFGASPDWDIFGARPFPIQGDFAGPIEAHSIHWTPDRLGMENIGRVAAGRQASEQE